VSVESEYQLQIENAEAVARYERVLLVDADRAGPEPFSMRRLYPGKSGVTFSTHSVSPESVLALSRALFDAEPEAWILGIRGYEFDDFGEGLSPRGQSNLAAAIEFVRTAIRDDSFKEVWPGGVGGNTSQDSRG
jgi:hydrogenase maturation protease